MGSDGGDSFIAPLSMGSAGGLLRDGVRAGGATPPGDLAGPMSSVIRQPSLPSGEMTMGGSWYEKMSSAGSGGNSLRASLEGTRIILEIPLPGGGTMQAPARITTERGGIFPSAANLGENAHRAASGPRQH